MFKLKNVKLRSWNVLFGWSLNESVHRRCVNTAHGEHTISSLRGWKDALRLGFVVNGSAEAAERPENRHKSSHLLGATEFQGRMRGEHTVLINDLKPTNL